MLHVSMLKRKMVILGLLTMVSAIPIVTGTAAAEVAGPFWVHREKGGEGEGGKIEPKAPENFSGSGGEQRFRAFIGTSEIELSAPSVQVKGAIFNSPRQGQIKAEIVYNQPGLLTPELKNCSLTLGKNNIIVAKGYLMWKWNGEKSQLEERPFKNQTFDGIFSAAEPPSQSSGIEKINLSNNAMLTVVALTGSGCGVLAGIFGLTGSYVGIPEQRVLGEFRKEMNITVIEPPEKGTFLQHYWTGERMQGAEVGLELAGNPAFYFLGKTTVVAAQQEVAVIE